ncbi:MAG: prepilin-type N-terminal cleavage/methylation domain-containing protein, partial [Clostridia bacterium]|nr:prepilin-type N-terminal cleavage/methylation domain-containing protein [Clostridia bacterium]
MNRNIGKNNKGFTLIELMVTVAIIAIVAISVGMFMITGAKSFASTSSEVNLQ